MKAALVKLAEAFYSSIPHKALPLQAPAVSSMPGVYARESTIFAEMGVGQLKSTYSSSPEFCVLATT